MKLLDPVPCLKLGVLVLGRVSTEELARGDSVSRQIEYGTLYARKELASDTNGEIHEIREEGVSGQTLNRDGIDRMLELAQNRTIRYVVVMDVARFGRNVEEGIRCIKKLVSLNVDVKVVTVPWLDHRTNHGKKEWARQLADAECERGVYRDKAIHGMTRKAQKGEWKGGPPSYGYKRMGKSQIAPDQAPAETIQLVFETFGRLKSATGVIAHFAAEGITLPHRSNSEKHRSAPPSLNKQFVELVLRNPVYIGFVPAPREKNELTKDIVPDLQHSGRSYFKGLHTPIVKRALWNKVQRILDRPTGRACNLRFRKGSDEYLLQSLLTCSCGEKFTNGGTGKPGGKKVTAYVCRSFSTKGASCDCKTRWVPSQEIEEAVIHVMAGLGQHPQLVKMISTNASSHTVSVVESSRAEISELGKKRTKLTREIQNAVSYITEHGGGVVADRLAQQAEKLAAEEKRLANEIDALQSKIEDYGDTVPSANTIEAGLQKFQHTVANLPRARLKRLLQLLLADIAVSRKRGIAGVAASSAVFSLEVSLSATGLQLAAGCPAGAFPGELGSPPPEKKPLGPIRVVFEIIRRGNKGNLVQVLSPEQLRANTATVAKETQATSDLPVDGNHPIYQAYKARELQNQGKLKKEIADAFGLAPSSISTLFAILRLADPIRTILSAPENTQLRDWFGIKRLNVLTARLRGMEDKAQIAYFEEQCRLMSAPARKHSSPRERRTR